METMEYYSAVNTNGVTPSAATWVDPEMVTLECRESEEGKHRLTSPIRGIYDTTPMGSLQNGNRLRDLGNRLVGVNGGEGGG